MSKPEVKTAEPRVGLANIARVTALVAARRELDGYIGGKDDPGSLPATIVRLAMPASLLSFVKTERLEMALRNDARAARAAIDAELKSLGFDLTQPPG